MILLKYKLTSILIISAFLMTISQNSVNGEWKIPSISDEIPNDFSIYENNFLKIDYPSSWELTETNYSIIFFQKMIILI